MATDTLGFERSDGVAVLTISSPDTRNALGPVIAAQLVEACDAIDADGDVGAAVLRGAGGTFCSGADLRAWARHGDQSDDVVFRENGAVYAALLRFGRLRVPSIAAVRGAAVGAGLNLMLAADLRVVADDARILGGFDRVRVHPGGGFFALAGRLAGREATAALGLVGVEVDGRRAAELGLAWECVPDGDVEDRALALARRPAADPELARLVVRSFREELGPPAVSWPVAVEFERASQMWSMQRRRSVATAEAAP